MHVLHGVRARDDRVLPHLQLESTTIFTYVRARARTLARARARTSCRSKPSCTAPHRIPYHPTIAFEKNGLISGTRILY